MRKMTDKPKEVNVSRNDKLLRSGLTRLAYRAFNKASSVKTPNVKSGKSSDKKIRSDF